MKPLEIKFGVLGLFVGIGVMALHSTLQQPVWEFVAALSILMVAWTLLQEDDRLREAEMHRKVDAVLAEEWDTVGREARYNYKLMLEQFEDHQGGYRDHVEHSWAHPPMKEKRDV